MEYISIDKCLPEQLLFNLLNGNLFDMYWSAVSTCIGLWGAQKISFELILYFFAIFVKRFTCISCPEWEDPKIAISSLSNVICFFLASNNNGIIWKGFADIGFAPTLTVNTTNNIIIIISGYIKLVIKI